MATLNEQGLQTCLARNVSVLGLEVLHVVYHVSISPSAGYLSLLTFHNPENLITLEAYQYIERFQRSTVRLLYIIIMFRCNIGSHNIVIHCPLELLRLPSESGN